MNDKAIQAPGSKPIAIWLLLGVAMIMIQVLLGGITRLTGSGLSITEWKPILGSIPPLNEADWQLAFDKYKQIGQFKHINFDFSIADFKFIYFWEWFHRLWARLIGFVFLLPFIYFIVKKMIGSTLAVPMLILFLLGGLQGALGWIMVKSGLNPEDVYVSHIRLSIHFMAALGLLSYTLWFALTLTIPDAERVAHLSLRKTTVSLTVMVFIQLVYGAFMAGLKAGGFAPTWPTMNGQWWPMGMTGNETSFFLTDNPITVQFIHRGLAYLILAMTVFWYVKAKKIKGSIFFSRYRKWPFWLVILQVILGIFTVSFSDKASVLLYLGVAHQFVAMLLLMSLVFMLYIVVPSRAKR